MEAIVRRRAGNETIRELPVALMPEISYRKALRSRFRLDQTTYTVRGCPVTAFQRFLCACGQASFNDLDWKPAYLEKLLLMLEKDGSDVARWYALNILLEHKVVVPLDVD